MIHVGDRRTAVGFYRRVKLDLMQQGAGIPVSVFGVLLSPLQELSLSYWSCNSHFTRKRLSVEAYPLTVGIWRVSGDEETRPGILGPFPLRATEPSHVLRNACTTLWLAFFPHAASHKHMISCTFNRDPTCRPDYTSNVAVIRLQLTVFRLCWQPEYNQA